MKGLLTVAAAIGLFSLSSAGLGPIDQATETMMEYQGSLMHTLGSLVRPNSITELAFSSYIDTGGQYFKFELIAGQKYNGTELSLTGKGALTAANTWALASQAAAGLGSWASSGTMNYADVPSGQTAGNGTIDSFFDVFFDLSADVTTITDVTYENTGIRTGSLGKITIKSGLTSKTYKGHDVYDLTTGKWTWYQGDPYPDNASVRTSAVGTSSGGGGGGRFTAYVDPVPGPAALAAPLIGFALGMWRRRSSRG